MNIPSTQKLQSVASPRIFHIPVPRPTEVSNNNTGSPESTTENHQTPIQREVLPSTLLQHNHKTHLFPTPLATARQHMKKTFIPGKPPHNNSRINQNQCFPRPYISVHNQQCPPLLPSSPDYHQRPAITGTPLHTKRHYSLQVPSLFQSLY